jgi:methylated-DNA-[protein]-cysteine S-methyltransferase
MLLARTAAGLAGAWFDAQQHHPGTFDAPVRPDDPLLRRAADQLRHYFDDAVSVFELALDPMGTPFQRTVWAALREIPSGRTCTYGEVARAIGAPAAVRAVGAAIGRNPISLIVPCHRVVGSNGALTGYAGGVERKRALLALEQRVAVAA